MRVSAASIAPPRPPHADEKIAVGTLDAARCPQFGVDYTVSIQGLTLSNSGPSPVYVSGYKTYATLSDGEESDEGESDEEFDSEDEALVANGGVLPGESSDEEGLPQAVPIRGTGEPSSSDDEDDSELDEDELDEEDEEEEEAVIMGESDDDDEPVEFPEDSDLDEFTDDDDEESEEEEEEEELAPAPAKRPRKDAAAATPVPDKSKPATPGTPAATPGSTADYVAALRQALTGHGPTRIGQLGSLVKRPAAAPKLKTVLSSNPKLFKHDPATDLVSLC